jgi:hypothetical protein
MWPLRTIRMRTGPSGWTPDTRGPADGRTGEASAKSASSSSPTSTLIEPTRAKVSLTSIRSETLVYYLKIVLMERRTYAQITKNSNSSLNRFWWSYFIVYKFCSLEPFEMTKCFNNLLVILETRTSNVKQTNQHNYNSCGFVV